MSKVNLTPDVSVQTAVFSEFFEPLFLGLLPSHGIESGLQLYHKDWSRIKNGIQKAREIFTAQAQTTSEEQEAAKQFSIDLTSE